MTRPLVAFDGVTFNFGSKRVLDSAGFVVNEGERAALVGPNGAGKTTVIRLLLGRLKPDLGEVQHAPGLRYAYLPQIIDFPSDATIGSMLAQKPAQVERLEAQMREIEARMADPAFYEEDGYEEVLRHYNELQREVATQSAKGDASGALPILQDLGMEDVDLERPMKELSGGQKTRVILGKALANHQDTDLLILDEPSNHLDIEAVEWLEDFLTVTYDGALLLVAHDQYLMDTLAEKVLEVENMKVWEWDGNFSEYKEQKAAYVRALEARRRREHEEMKRQLAIIEEIKRRNRFDHQARSKAIRLEKMNLRRETIASQHRKTFKFSLGSVSKSSNDVLRIEDLRKSFGGQVLFDRAEMHVMKGDKIGLIGPNGTGKTTLLRMITGRDKPDGGVLEISPGVKLGYFDQEHSGLNPDRTLIEEIRSVRPERRMPEEEARGMLGRFLFKGEDAFKITAKLSGGEKARLSLAKFLLGPTNLLVLDEPTNHLDLESQEVVENALADYTGTLIVVSHDRHFLDAVVNKIAVVHNGKIGVFPGNFSETRTLTRMSEFTGDGKKEFRVRSSFTDYDSGKRYVTGERVVVTGGETQTTKRLFRLAIDRGWLEAA